MSTLKSDHKRTKKGRRDISRREFLALGGSAALGLTLAACAPSQSTGAAPTTAPTVISQAPRKIVLSTWGGPTEEGVKKFVAPRFEKKYNATLEYDIGGMGARLTKIEAQSADPQTTVFLGSDDLVFQGMRKGILGQFNAANIPNIGSLADWAKPMKIEGYGVGRTLIAAGLVPVNSMVSAPITSWMDLWRPEFVKKLAFFAPGNGFLPGMLVIASELHGGSQDNIDPGLAALAELRPLAQLITYTDYEAQRKAGDITLSTDIDYHGLIMQKDGLDVSWILPKEGAIAQLSCAALVKGGPNPDLGEGLIDLLLDPEVQLQLTQEIFNAPTNQQVKLEAPLADQVMYGPRIEQLRWFDMEFITDHRSEWIERITTEVVPKWSA